MDIQKGTIIRIGKEKYDVLNVREEIDRYDSERNKFIGEHTAIELHKIGDSSLHATHLLKIYHDNKKAILLKIEQKGKVFLVHDGEKVSLDDIKLILSLSRD